MGAVVEKFLFPIFYWAWHIVNWFTCRLFSSVTALCRIKRKPISQSCFETISHQHYPVLKCTSCFVLFLSRCDLSRARVTDGGRSGGQKLVCPKTTQRHETQRACHVGRWQLGNTTRKVACQITTEFLQSKDLYGTLHCLRFWCLCDQDKMVTLNIDTWYSCF